MSSFHHAPRRRNRQHLEWSSTFYGMLAVPLAATKNKIDDAFIALARLLHPDEVEEKMRKIHAKCAFGKPQKNCEVCQRTDQFSKLTMARATLLHEQLRKKYDMQLQIAGFKPCPTCKGAGQAQKKGTGGFKAVRHVQMVACTVCNTTGAVRDIGIVSGGING